MSVSMDKLSNGVAEPVAGAGLNDGTGTIRVIGGVPFRKFNGPVIRVAGMRYAGRRITRVVIEPVFGDEISQVTLVSADGVEHSYGDVGPVQTLRSEWLRRTLSDGTFAGVARMR